MKIHILSDLHIEFAPFELPETDADVLILAGDTAPGDRGVKWVQSLELKIPVIYIMGNHEYYRQAYPHLLDKLKAMVSGTNIHLLEDESLEIQDVTFLGCTLWTDFNLLGTQYVSEFTVSQAMNDFRLIRKSPSWSKFKTSDAVRIHRQSKFWLEKQLAEIEGKVVVITHHAPSSLSIPEQFQNSEINPGYASNLDDLILDNQPELWIHGHMHSCSDYKIGNTRILANTRGYPGETGNGFDPGLVVEI
jgi:Icc-related predicted phosphoesterase